MSTVEITMTIHLRRVEVGSSSVMPSSAGSVPVSLSPTRQSGP
jgi:hypothetical protein